jgi:hypothetical protein
MSASASAASAARRRPSDLDGVEAHVQIRIGERANQRVHAGGVLLFPERQRRLDAQIRIVPGQKLGQRARDVDVRRLEQREGAAEHVEVAMLVAERGRDRVGIGEVADISNVPADGELVASGSAARRQVALERRRGRPSRRRPAHVRSAPERRRELRSVERPVTSSIVAITLTMRVFAQGAEGHTLPCDRSSGRWPRAWGRGSGETRGQHRLRRSRAPARTAREAAGREVGDDVHERAPARRRGNARRRRQPVVPGSDDQRGIHREDAELAGPSINAVFSSDRRRPR